MTSHLSVVNELADLNLKLKFFFKFLEEKERLEQDCFLDTTKPSIEYLRKSISTLKSIICFVQESFDQLYAAENANVYFSRAGFANYLCEDPFQSLFKKTVASTYLRLEQLKDQYAFLTTELDEAAMLSAERQMGRQIEREIIPLLSEISHKMFLLGTKGVQHKKVTVSAQALKHVFLSLYADQNLYTITLQNKDEWGRQHGISGKTLYNNFMFYYKRENRTALHKNTSALKALIQSLTDAVVMLSSMNQKAHEKASQELIELRDGFQEKK